MRLELLLQPQGRRSGTTATRCGARASTSPRACCCATATRSTRRASRRTLLDGRGRAGVVLAVDGAKPLGEEEMKVLLDDRRPCCTRINKAHRPGRGGGRVHRRDADRAARPRSRWPTRCEATWRARPVALLRGRLPGAAPTAAGDVGDRADRRRRLGRGRRPRATWPGRGRSRAAAERAWSALPAGHRHRPRRRRRLGDRCSPTADLQRRARGRGGRARPGRGDRRDAARARCANADVFTVEGGTVEAATRRCRAELGAGTSTTPSSGSAAARTLDVAKYAASLTGLPMVAVATSLAHDGLASPVASLEHDGRKGSYGVQMPIARRGRPRLRAPRSTRGALRSGIGDASQQPLRDRRLASSPSASAGSAVDGLAVDVRPHRRRLAALPPRRTASTTTSSYRAGRGARALGGWRWPSAGISRPCSGADHEILHAIDHLLPRARPPRRAGRGGRPVRVLPARRRRTSRGFDACLHRHGLPRLPARPRPLRGAVRRGRRARARRPARTATPSSSTSTSTCRRSAGAYMTFVVAFDR